MAATKELCIRESAALVLTWSIEYKIKLFSSDQKELEGYNYIITEKSARI